MDSAPVAAATPVTTGQLSVGSAVCGGFVHSAIDVLGRRVVCVKTDVFGLMVGCSLQQSKIGITDVGAAKLAEALPNSKLTVLV